MSIEVKVPVLPESIADAVIATWYKKVGDSIRRDETLVDLETDKVVLEVPAIKDGTVTEILFNEGDTVTANQVLAVIDENVVATAEETTKSEPVTRNLATDNTSKAAKNIAANDSDMSEETDVVISPSARKMMEENAINASQINGSGRNGRILKEDVLSYMSTAEKLSKVVADKPVQDKKEDITERAHLGGRIEKRVPMTRLRARIAERLLQSQQTAAILTTFNEVNMKPVMDLRALYKEKFEKEFGVKLGFMSFFVKAVVESLKKFPAVNASVDGSDVVYHGYYDIGVAVSGPNGLVVPILRNAEILSLAEIEQVIIGYASKARDNKLGLEDITGGTFTISNGGIFGSMLSTPILNPPQSAILGMHNIKERAMVVNGEVVVLPMMYLALSYDHRLIDGREAVQCLVAIKELLEDPSRMLLGV